MSSRRAMNMWDWVNAAAILAVGVFLGLALDGIIALVAMGAWFSAVVIVLIFGGLFLFILAMEWVFERIFPSGVQPARNSKKKERKPLAVLLSLPAGIALGLLGAQFGLGDLLLS